MSSFIRLTDMVGSQNVQTGHLTRPREFRDVVLANAGTCHELSGHKV